MIVTPAAIEVESAVISPEKKNGPNDLLIVQLKEVATKAKVDDATLAIAPDTGYRKVMEVLFTLGQSDIDDFHLLVAGPNGTASIDTEPPSVETRRADAMSGASRRPVERLNLSAIVVRDGISLKMSAGNIAPGCDAIGPGLAVAGRDFDAVAACAAKLKASKPAFASEDTVMIAGNADIDFQTIVRTIDALRTSFPNVQFGIPK